MSEVIGYVDSWEDIADKGDFSHVEIKRITTKTGQVYNRAYGVDEDGKRRIVKNLYGSDDSAVSEAEDAYLEGWGYSASPKIDATPKLETETTGRDAVWHAHGGDIPVVITGIAGEHDDVEYLNVEGSDTAIPASQVEFIDTTEDEAAPIDHDYYDGSEEENQRSSWKRFSAGAISIGGLKRFVRNQTEKIKDASYSAQTSISNGFYNTIDRLAPKTNNLNAEGRNRRAIGRKTAILGGLALAGVTGFAMYKLGFAIHQEGHRHSNSAFNDLQYQLNTIKADRLAEQQVFEAKLNQPFHTEFYNAATGHRVSGVELPSGLHLQADGTGHHDIVNSNGGIVLDNVTQDRQGNISAEDRKRLVAKGFRLVQDRLQVGDGKFRYITRIF